jgi:hypothetical protein
LSSISHAVEYNVFTVCSSSIYTSEGIESAQKNQKKVGTAEENPDTSGPAENLREQAAELIYEEEDS